MKRFILYTNIISPHQVPLMQAIWSRLGVANAAYVFTESLHEERCVLGWGGAETPEGCFFDDHSENMDQSLKMCDILLSGNRNVELFENRETTQKKTLYMSERWFKPGIGFFRILHLGYFRMAYRIVRLLKKGTYFFYFPIGIHAARDMARFYGLLNGDWRCLFSPPKLVFESKPGGRLLTLRDAMKHGILTEQQIQKAKKNGFVQVDETLDTSFPIDSLRYGLSKMYLWGYFVDPGKPCLRKPNGSQLKLLWVGRLLKWKRVDTIIRAVASLKNSGMDLSLTIIGDGSEQTALKTLARRLNGNVSFCPSLPIKEIREQMRTHDIYVLASNAYEGWGAVVSEALEEGMICLGTHEAGSSATVLDEIRRYSVGDVAELESCIQKCYSFSPESFRWTAVDAAKVIFGELEYV